MPNKDLTEIAVILDRSGSMTAIRDDTQGGFNTFLADQQAVEGEANLTLVLFDHEYLVVHDRVAIGEVRPLDSETYVPRGATALLDAVGRTINQIGAQLDALPEDDRPDKVVVVIMTDGHENSSKEFTHEKVRELVEHQQDTYDWQFIFTGAGIDAFAAGASIGVLTSHAMSHTHDGAGVAQAYGAVSRSVGSYRKGEQDDASFKKPD